MRSKAKASSRREMQKELALLGALHTSASALPRHKAYPCCLFVNEAVIGIQAGRHSMRARQEVTVGEQAGGHGTRAVNNSTEPTAPNHEARSNAR